MAAPDQHKLSSLADVAALFRKLPAERAELMLSEVCDAIRLMAPITEVVEAAGASLSLLGPLTWINDTKGVGTFNVLTKEGGEPELSMKFDLTSGGAQ